MKTNELEADSLKRVFGLPTLVIYGVGDILGAGIYAVIGKIAGLSGTLVWASFLSAMTVAAFTGFIYLKVRQPEANDRAIPNTVFGRATLKNVSHFAHI